MYDKNENTIMFPHTIPGRTLLGKSFTFNDIKGGMKPIADFGLVQNSFFGGNVKTLGFLTEYGLYACPSYWSKQVLGFYIADPNMLTELGKRAVEERFKGITVLYEKYDADGRVLTDEEVTKRDQLKKEALETGIANEHVTHASAAELRALIDTFKSGESGSIATVEDGAREAYTQEVKQAAPRQKGRAPRGRTTTR